MIELPEQLENELPEQIQLIRKFVRTQTKMKNDVTRKQDEEIQKQKS